MRKVAFTAMAGVMFGASTAIALTRQASRLPIARPAVAPLSAGSRSHPQGIKLRVSLGWQGYAPANQPMVTKFDIWFPRGSVYSGAKFPKCSIGRLAAAGPAGCPKGSIMGTGTGTATADTTITHPSITVVNGGANVVYFYTVLNNPARVQEPVVGHITRQGGNFTYHLSATIPPSLQVVAGVPIKLTSLDITAGRGTWLATTTAPAGIKVQTTYQGGARTSSMLWVQDS